MNFWHIIHRKVEFCSCLKFGERFYMKTYLLIVIREGKLPPMSKILLDLLDVVDE